MMCVTLTIKQSGDNFLHHLICCWFHQLVFVADNHCWKFRLLLRVIWSLHPVSCGIINLCISLQIMQTWWSSCKFHLKTLQKIPTRVEWAPLVDSIVPYLSSSECSMVAKKPAQASSMGFREVFYAATKFSNVFDKFMIPNHNKMYNQVVFHLVQSLVNWLSSLVGFSSIS